MTLSPLSLSRVVRELIRYQVDTVQDEDEDSNSPLHLACFNGHLAVAKVLINANCNVEARYAWEGSRERGGERREERGC